MTDMTRAGSSAILGLTVVVLALLSPVAARGSVTLNNASAVYSLVVPGKQIGGTIAQVLPGQSTSVTLDARNTLDFGSNGLVQGVAKAVISFFAPRPQIDVEVNAVTTPPPHCGTCGMDASAFGQVDMQYQMSINQLGPIPTIIPVSSLPISITGNVHVSGDLPRRNHARVNGPAFFGLVAPPSNSRTATVSLSIGAIYDVRMHVEAAAFVAGGTSMTKFSSRGQAVADPTFAFDQSAFDRIMGTDTFVLADFFGFQYSPNLVTDVPPVPAGVIIQIINSILLE